jgi:hypothetical protein
MPKGKPKDGSKNPGGRPKQWTDDAIDALAEALLAWSRDPSAMFLASFCRDHDTHRQRLYEFSKKNDKFADALKRAETACEANIAEGTADGAIPPAFGIFGLKQRGWTDKQEIEHSGEVKSKVVQVQLPSKKAP